MLGGGHGGGCLKSGGEVEAGCLEFRPAHSKALCENTHHQVVFLLLGVPGNGLEVQVVVIAVDGPRAHCQAELDVGFDTTRVGCAVEEAEFHCALGEESVEVASLMLSST